MLTLCATQGNSGDEMQRRHCGANRAAKLARERLLAQLLLLVILLSNCVPSAFAAVLDKAGLAKYFPPPYVVGERDATLPMWPLFRGNIARAEGLLGYVFESNDLVALPGYSGTPPNLLIAIAPDGQFIAVSVLSHNEPIFKHGVSEDSLGHFVDQYHGLNVKQSIKVSATNQAAQNQASSTPMIDGVSRATVSVRIINDTVLAASLKIARAKLGLAPGRDPALAPHLKVDDGATLTAADITGKSLLSKTSFPTADIEKAFGKAFPKDADIGAGTDPNAASTEVWIAYLSVPQIGRALLGKAGFDKLMQDYRKGDHAILIATKGHYGFRGPDQRAGVVPDQMALTQDALPINVSEASAIQPPDSDAIPKGLSWTVLKVNGAAGLDATRPWQLAMRITRKNGELIPRRETKDFAITLQAPAEYFEAPEVQLEGWQAVWWDQRGKIALTLVSLISLATALAMPKQLAAHTPAFRIFRWGFLATTLGGIGWWGQGQLSIHNILAVINAAKSNGDFGFLLLDPVSLFLWVFVLGSLVVFGRGTFCGWLCPFGAFQEFTAEIAKRLKVSQLKIPYALDRKLRLVKYGVLAAIIAAAVISSPWAEGISEIEPFKTAITLGFDRPWPYVIFAVALLLLSGVVFKGFYLYLCPLGAALALLGRVRLFDWIPRRKECGSPCQLCNVRCQYGAIEPKGEINYDECFQCMDCVVIYHDPKVCVPEVLARKRKPVATLIPTPRAARQPVTAESVT